MVVKLRVADTAAALVMSTGVVAPKLNVGGKALLGPEATIALGATLHVNPFDGVSVIVDVFPVVAPAVTVTAVPVIAKPGGVAGVTGSENDADALV
jgi:hypothetical protein